MFVRLILILAVWVCGQHDIRVLMCVLGASGGWKRALDLLGLELQTVVSCHVGAGNPGPLQEQPVLLTAKPSL